MQCGGRPIATPARTATCGLLAAVDTPLLESASGVLQRLPAELRHEGCLDLSRRSTPELQAWSLNQHPSAVKLLCGSQGWRSQRCRRWPLATPTLCAEAGRQGLTLQQAIKALLLQPLRDCLEMKRAFYNRKVRRNFVQKCLCRIEPSLGVPARSSQVHSSRYVGIELK